ncbi:MAG: sugar porter family MFS transporter [Lentisphaerota bacterium]
MERTQKDNEIRSKKFMTAFVVAASALAGCLYGLDIGAIAGALTFIQKEMNLTGVQEGWIVGAVLYGGAFSILVTGFLADIFGRKNMIVVSAVIFIVGVIISSYAVGFKSLLWGRLIMGIGVGISAILVPLYLSETVPANIRGRAVACFQLVLTAGILLANLIGLAFNKSGNWRAMFLVLVIPGLVFFLGALFLPESPAWLFMKKKIDKTKKVLLKFHSEENADLILSGMTTLNEEKTQAKNQSIFKKAYIIPFIIAFLIANFNQTTGVNSILQYGMVIFQQSGVSSPAVSQLLNTAVTLLNVIITIIAIALIDKLGRKPLLTYSTGGVVISLLLLSLASILSTSALKITLLTIGMFGFMGCFSFGCGVVVWLAMSELLPTAIRSKGLAICLFANSMVSSILATVFPIIREAIGYAGLFLMLAIFTIIYFVVAKFFLPETKGKTIEEIEEYWVLKYEKRT